MQISMCLWKLGFSQTGSSLQESEAGVKSIRQQTVWVLVFRASAARSGKKMPIFCFSFLLFFVWIEMKWKYVLIFSAGVCQPDPAELLDVLVSVVVQRLFGQLKQLVELRSPGFTGPKLQKQDCRGTSCYLCGMWDVEWSLCCHKREGVLFVLIYRSTWLE